MCFYSVHNKFPCALLWENLIVYTNILIYYTNEELVMIQFFLGQTKTVSVTVRFKFCKSYNFGYFFNILIMSQFSSTLPTNNGWMYLWFGIWYVIYIFNYCAISLTGLDFISAEPAKTCYSLLMYSLRQNISCHNL